MKNRKWISNRSIYDFLCYINEPNDVQHCTVTRCSGRMDSLRCRKYNTCKRTYSLKECGYSSCNSVCKNFNANCEKCIADYLNEERRFY